MERHIIADTDVLKDASMEKINVAVLYEKDLKDRYTVLWSHYDLFGGFTNERLQNKGCSYGFGWHADTA